MMKIYKNVGAKECKNVVGTLHFQVQVFIHRFFSTMAWAAEPEGLVGDLVEKYKLDERAIVLEAISSF